MKKIILLTLITLIPLFSISIEFQSKLYITPKDGENYAWKQSKNRLCIQAKYGVYGIDVSDLKQPKILKRSGCKFFYLESDDKRLLEKWGVVQNIIYSSDKKRKFIVQENRFFVLDVSNSKNEKIIGEYAVFNYENHMYISDILFSKDERYAYVINSISGVQIYDMNNLNNFKALGKLENMVGTDEIYDSVLVDDNYIYSYINESSVIIDVRNKMKPKRIERNFMEAEQLLFPLDKTHLLLFHDNLCDVFTWFIEIIDTSNPLEPKEVYRLKIKDFLYDMVVDGDRIFFLGKKGLQIYEVKR